MMKLKISLDKENTACAEPLAKAEADVALIQAESYTFLQDKTKSAGKALFLTRLCLLLEGLTADILLHITVTVKAFFVQNQNLLVYKIDNLIFFHGTKDPADSLSGGTDQIS